MNGLFPEPLLADLKAVPVIPVVVLDDADAAADLGRTLLDAGVRAVEMTLRTPTALDAVRKMRAACPQLRIGAGTILSPEQARQAVAAGASFGVSPGINPVVVRAATDAGLPFAPGVMTPSDIEQGLGCGCRLFKFFPAEPAGGLKLLAAMATPYRHLGVKFVPLGGVTLATLPTWLASADIHAVGGSWITPPNLLAKRDWTAISALATAAVRAATARVE